MNTGKMVLILFTLKVKTFKECFPVILIQESMQLTWKKTIKTNTLFRFFVERKYGNTR